VIGEDPGHGHLDGELDPLAHCHLQVELPVPQLGQVTAVLENKIMSVYLIFFLET